MNNTDLEREISETIDRVISDGGIPRADWVTHEVVGVHHPVGVEVSDFDRICAYGFVRNLVRAATRRFKTHEDETDPQVALPGFVRLQKAYLVERDIDGELEQVVVPTDAMTRDEIFAKVEELRSMATGCHQHADELLRYYEQRVHAEAL